MNLADLLQATAAEHLDDRTDLVSGDPDELWSDAYLTRQFNDAQRRLCRRAWCIVDVGNPTAGVITLATGVSVYSLHKSVIRVYYARPSDRERPCLRYDDVALMSPSPYLDVDFQEIMDNTQFDLPGRPIAISTDTGSRLMRVYRTPSVTENGLQLILKVARYPITDLTLDNTDGTPEVPEEYHDTLVLYAAGRALTLPNVDSNQKAEGRALLTEFDSRCHEARQDRIRSEFNGAAWSFASTTSVLGERQFG